MKHQVALIPYWLRECPTKLSISDNGWWFAPLQKFKVLIFVGPYLINEYHKDLKGPDICKIKTSSLNFSLKEIESYLDKENSKIPFKDISLIWNVLEVSATCRILDLKYFGGTKVALIGDTHHLKKPISSLISYINNCRFNFLFCTQSHHSFFFETLCDEVSVHSFPYSVPSHFNDSNVIKQISKQDRVTKQEPLYRGNIMSSFHHKRSRLINFLLVNSNIEIKERLNWDEWIKSLYNEEHRLIISTINGNFSPQIMYPLLYGKTCFTDKISSLNWLGEIMKNQRICFTHNNEQECLENIRMVQSFSEPRDINKEHIMQARASMCVYSKLNDMAEVQHVFTNLSNQYYLLNNLRTAKEVELRGKIESEMLTRTKFNIEALYYFERAQEMYNHQIPKSREILQWLSSIPISLRKDIELLLPDDRNK